MAFCQRTRLVVYLLLTASAGFVELGSLIYGLKIGLPLWLFPVIAVAYQISNFAPFTLRSRPFISILLGLISIGLGLLINDSFIVMIIYTAFVSWTIQCARSLLKGDLACSRTTKRLIRLLGFACSFTYGGIVPIVVLALLSITGAGISLLEHGEHSRTEGLKIQTSWLSSLMFLHQVHYFAYYFTVPLYFYFRYDLPLAILSVTFILGWISYTLAHYAWRSHGKHVFIAGHFISCVCIIGLVTSHNILESFVWWFLTGFGGGTVYVLRTLSPSDKWDESLDFWESCGHVVGPLIVLPFLLSGSGIEAGAILGASVALIVGVSAMAQKWTAVSE